ncbi:hypothetical protein IC006_2312 [Sulfuracidifex tepidarius]|uniref:Uncharacterized protein n=1 Tax=Sulfuracidifex tepidarius TaxID=1294262 RepID=A0A510DYF0_9CREN|nr:hypothetical protein [Sulfuracidifex tepidarius]BBG24978.1 hypothetical protein IC006_2312 [Sulfuracidifex tepidarius]
MRNKGAKDAIEILDRRLQTTAQGGQSQSIERSNGNGEDDKKGITRNLTRNLLDLAINETDLKNFMLNLSYLVARNKGFSQNNELMSLFNKIQELIQSERRKNKNDKEILEEITEYLKGVVMVTYVVEKSDKKKDILDILKKSMGE